MRRPEPINKVALFRDLGYAPHAGQVEVHRSTAERRVVACGVRWGKTLGAAMEAIAATLAPAEYGIGWIVAPTYDLADKVYREVVRLAADKLKHRVVAIREGERRLLLRNLGGGISEVRAKSADNPTSLLGEGLDWLVVDEAARLHPRIWQGHLSQRLLDKRGFVADRRLHVGLGQKFEPFLMELGAWTPGADRDDCLDTFSDAVERLSTPPAPTREISMPQDPFLLASVLEASAGRRLGTGGVICMEDVIRRRAV